MILTKRALVLLLVAIAVMALLQAWKEPPSRGKLLVGHIQPGMKILEVLGARFRPSLMSDRLQHSVHFFVAGSPGDKDISFRDGLITAVKAFDLEVGSRTFSAGTPEKAICEALGPPDSVSEKSEAYKLREGYLHVELRKSNSTTQCGYFILADKVESIDSNWY